MQIFKLTISALLLLVVTGTYAQTNVNGRLSWWPAYYLKYSINRKWALNSDLQLRNFADQPVLGLMALRTGLYYSINKQWSTGVGVAWFHNESIVDNKEVDADEFRVWQELKHEWRSDRWQIANRLRTEQRYFTDQDEMIYRFRYFISADYGFAKNWKVIAGNELMWQSSERRKTWDQYRLWLGGEYAFNENNQVQMVFMNWWQFSAHSYQPVIRINFVQTIN